MLTHAVLRVVEQYERNETMRRSVFGCLVPSIFGITHLNISLSTSIRKCQMFFVISFLAAPLVDDNTGPATSA